MSTLIRILVGALIVLQAPFLFIAFIAGGTDGHRSSQLIMWAITLPIAACGLIVLFRLATAHALAMLDWFLIGGALLPSMYLTTVIYRAKG